MKIKNWSKFQHFKDRRPPWVKLYRDLLDDMEWHQLDPLASKVLVTLWLLASEDDEQSGNLPSIKTIAWRLRMSETDVKACISKLSHWLDHDDISVISEQHQSDTPETETEAETKKEVGGESPRKRSAPPPRKKREQKTLAEYLAECKASAEKPIPDDHHIRKWAADAGIVPEMLQIAWVKFRERYTEGEKGKGKRYKDWAGHFATSVKDNWFKVWFASGDGIQWTTNGMTYKAVLDARMTSQETQNA
jgi:hypothetical protein